MTILIHALQALLIVLGAPLLRGWVSKIKARIQRRQGAAVWRPYADLAKLFRKEDLVPPLASGIFLAAPRIVFCATATATLLIPVFHPAALLGAPGDFVLLVALLALARFALVLGAMDGGGAFGGMGGSREAMVSALAEGPFLLGLTSVAILARSSQISVITGWTLGQNFFDVSAVHLLAFSTLAMVAIAETGRIPVDNPTTHLELTMIHEAMVLEHSGPSLAFLEWAGAVKLSLMMSLLIALFFPWGMADGPTLQAIALSAAAFLGKIVMLGLVLALFESSIAKLRTYAVPDFLGIASATGFLAVVFTLFGER
ncbi:MAG TPA: NADH-quinone oxidoreductase subunit H [Terriglobia bacterium]|nr:NADH-quinone oxidoreductase subunit H [Terriglobia bacterium]